MENVLGKSTYLLLLKQLGGGYRRLAENAPPPELSAIRTLPHIKKRLLYLSGNFEAPSDKIGPWSTYISWTISSIPYYDKHIQDLKP
jgi:hypothetical protein